MKFNFKFDDLIGYAQLTAEPGPYDAIPSQGGLICEFVPSSAPRPDFLAAAGALAFYGDIERQIVTESEIGNVVASGIAKLLQQDFMHIPNVSFQPKDPVRMPNIASLEIPGIVASAPVSNGAFQNRELILSLPEASARVGWSMALPRIDVPTNALHLAQQYPTFSVGWWAPFIATVLLLADTFQIGCIRVPKISEPDANRIRPLLRSLDMRIEVGEIIPSK